MSKRRGEWLGKMRSDPQQVPMQREDRSKRCTVPEGVARLAYEEYSYQYGTGQSFERLHERGGFGEYELIALLADLIERERESVEVPKP